MTGGLLRRGTAAPPVRAVHLGLGNFFRAHQAWYTDRAGDEWGIAAFTGRRPDLADAMAAQDGLYTLVTRTATGDRHTVVRSVVRAHPAADHGTWLDTVASPDVRVVTLTVTEAGYLRDGEGDLDLAAPSTVADVEALRSDLRAPVGSAPAKLLAGLAARRARDAGPVALVPCDNLPDNGAALRRVLTRLAEQVDPSLVGWLADSVTTATTMVDRITPAPTAADRESVLASTGVQDSCPVVTEPFSEWVVAGRFPGGRPAWETAGAVLTDDVTPFEQRKLWLLNGGHSLLAYVGALRGCTTVEQALRDDVCSAQLHEWWAACGPHLRLGPAAAERYCGALVDRFANPRIRHGLAQIAVDGSQKLPVRLLPVLARERAAGRLPEAAVSVLAAWLLHLRGGSVPVQDVRSAQLQAAARGALPTAVAAVLAALDPQLADDAELVTAVQHRAQAFPGR